MRLFAVVATVTLLSATPYPSHDVPGNPPILDDPHRLGGSAMSPEPAAAPVEVGDPAPDFSFLRIDGRWSRFRDLLAQGPVLLVFGTEEPVLRALQGERESLVRMGVFPVAVTELKGGGARGLGERLGLNYLLIPDARGIVATQFNCVHPETLRPMRGWFVVDRSGTVRALGRGALPPRRWARVAADALGLPAPDLPRPAGTR